MNRNQVGGKLDVIKGRVKKAAGELAGDSRLKSEGTVDKAVGAVKKVVGDVQDKIDQNSRPRTQVTIERK